MNEITDFVSKEQITIGIATDHGGFELKTNLLANFSRENIKLIDVGPYEFDATDDYPDYAGRLCLAISRGEIDAGILLCRSGVGMGINANRFHGVRAAVANNKIIASKSREHNCSNVLVLPSKREGQPRIIMCDRVGGANEGDKEIYREIIPTLDELGFVIDPPYWVFEEEILREREIQSR